MFGWQLLATSRLNTIIKTLNIATEAPSQLIFLNSTPVVPATDGELTAVYEGRVVSADAVADDAVAGLTAGGKVTITAENIPNFKQGSLITQEVMKLLRRIEDGGGVRSDSGFIENYARNELNNKLAAIRVSLNRIIAGMHMDSFSYRKRGLNFTNVSWGMPSSLKFTPSPAWTAANLATMTPIDDLLAYKLAASGAGVGENYNRIRLSRSQFSLIVRSDNFRNYAKILNPGLATGSVFPTGSLKLMQPLFEGATGLQVEFSDGTFREELEDGRTITGRYVPDNIAILGDSSDDNNASAMDLANGIVQESEVGSFFQGSGGVGALGVGPQYGPFAYSTGSPDLNPPNAKIWAVARSFPRKHRATATARITMYPEAAAFDATA